MRISWKVLVAFTVVILSAGVLIGRFLMAAPAARLVEAPTDSSIVVVPNEPAVRIPPSATARPIEAFTAVATAAPTTMPTSPPTPEPTLTPIPPTNTPAPPPPSVTPQPPVPTHPQPPAPTPGPEAFEGYLKRTYGVVGDYRLKANFDFSGTELSGLPITARFSMDVYAFQDITSKVRKKDLHDWGVSILRDMKAHWPGRDVYGEIAWVYYLDTLPDRNDSDCHYTGDYSAEENGWYNVEYLVSASYIPDIKSERITVCDGL